MYTLETNFRINQFETTSSFYMWELGAYDFIQIFVPTMQRKN